ncbi:TPA: efflux RND transporter permease subunit [Candidatus Saccharibacteria bacterium]|nr:efflux RND transporter permease subunit [Candidatus Saccharibacteria bacterium]HIO87473.1 efflux RND transporter permease subunit [Candidatus Saccharibacteria bacterium]
MANKGTSGFRDFLSNVSVRFFDEWKIKSAVFGLIFIFGLLSYTTFLPREGFPPIQFPLTLVNGVYFVDDAEAVDRDVVQPALAAIEDVEGITETFSNTGPNNFTFFAFFDEDVDAEAANTEVQSRLADANVPDGVEFDAISLNPAAYLNEYDLLLSVGYVPNQTGSEVNVDIEEIQDKAAIVAEEFKQDERIANAEVVELVQQAPDPATGEIVSRQTGFNFFGTSPSPGSSDVIFYKAVTVGINKTDSIDILELNDVVKELSERLERDDRLRTDSLNTGYYFDISIGADFGSSIATQINSLQSNLFSGILAVSLISWLLITWRASLITAVFMLGVMLVTMIVLLAVGYTLNTITLFALVLSLGLFVDDATIVIEAIVAARAKGRKPREAIKEAVSKVAPASFAGSLTTILVFLPLTFISGILGEFIRLMPVTVIISLTVSLLLSLTLIPLLSRFGLKNMQTKPNAKTRMFDSIAQAFAGLPLLLKTRPRIGKHVAVGMVLLSFVFVMGTGYFAQKVEFNIFPASDDSDQLNINYEFAQGTSLQQAELIAERANTVITEEVGENMVRALYGGFSPSNERGADIVVELVPFTDREVTSFELIEVLEESLQQEIGQAAEVTISQIDNGPPVEDLPFKVQIIGEDPANTVPLAQDIQDFLTDRTIERANGTTSTITETDLSGVRGVARTNGDRYVEVSAGFEDSDVSALVTAAQTAVEEEFTDSRLAEYGDQITLGFDFGQESDSAESFAALGVVFPVAILAILVLLAIQFRSILQPLLIILAIPFSIFGVFLGLYVTDNSLSFFSAIGMIGLIGIAVNNTILLTDYANQEKQAGKGRVEAISSALQQRFRPLLATTITTIVALLPLALNDPFWEPLAYTIIFGLASSTILVILSFPYYYIMSETASAFAKRGYNRLRKK